MRVLLAHKFHHMVGGAEVFYFEVGRVLKANGHEVAYFSTEHSDNVKTHNVEYFVPPPEYLEGGLLSKMWNSKDIFFSKEKYRKMLAAIDDFKPDIIHAFAIHVHLTPSILKAAKERGIPVVMSCNDYKHICPNYKLYDGRSVCESCKGGRFYNATLKRCCKNSFVFSVASSVESYLHEFSHVYDELIDKYLFASNFMLNKTKEFWGEKKVSYGVLRNPFNASNYEPFYGGDYALYFGRVVDEKGVDALVEAMRFVDFPLKIVGSGPGLARVESLLKEKNIANVELIGELWGKELDKVLLKARFVVVPSLWHENFPYVIFQSFASGKPVVGSNRGGIPELIENDRGLVVEPTSTLEFSSVMQALWDDEEKCFEMGKKARDFVVTEFSDDKFYKAIIDNYMSVIK